jgi:hypothetical protein
MVHSMKTRPILLAAALALSAGPAIAARGPSFTAVVNEDGSLARGLGAISSSVVGPGQYEVDFNQDINRCGFTATVGLSGSTGSSNFGTVNVAIRSGNKHALLVQTFDVGGNPFDLGFHVIVAC